MGHLHCMEMHVMELFDTFKHWKLRLANSDKLCAFYAFLWQDRLHIWTILIERLYLDCNEKTYVHKGTTELDANNTLTG